MKKYLAPFAVAVVLFALAPAFAYYQSKVISNDSSVNFEPRINNKGHVVWHGNDKLEEDKEIYFYNGRITKQITNNSTQDANPRINNKNDIVWENDELGGIFLYDNRNVSPIGSGKFPEINNKKQIIFEDSGSIMLWENGIKRRLGDGTKPKINNKGEAVWQDLTLSHGGYGIQRFDGIMARQIGVGYSPVINNKGETAWVGVPDGENDLEVFFYDCSNAKRITNDSLNDDDVAINNKGQMVWKGGCAVNVGCDGFASINFYDGKNTVVINRTISSAGEFSINNKGQFVWTNGRLESPNSEIFIFDSGNINQLTFNAAADIEPRINRKGDVVWVGEGVNGVINYAANDERAQAFSSYGSNDDNDDED